ncbi:MAG: hemerythrin domain-containing protein [Anaerolineales bacterium]|nr:hemerythrin domain-containing protein [Anaerolineales bacterium]
MKVIQALMEDHRLIDRFLTCLEIAAERLDNGQEIRLGLFSDIITFNKEFLENTHQKAEEAVLFEAMIKHGLAKKDRSLSIAMLEHEQSQIYIRRLHSAVERWQSGKKNARSEVIRNALGFVSLIRQHIQDEDSKLYPKAKKIIPETAQSDVIEAYDTFMQKGNDQGIFAKYESLVNSLESEIA